MKIPKKIQIAGLEIDVIVAPNLFKEKQLGGFLDYPNQRMLIAGDLAPQMQEVSLIHETVHQILFAMGESKLRDDERFVEGFSHLLHQALKGMI